MDPNQNPGRIGCISGPVVTGVDLSGCTMREMVKVGKEELFGEVIRIDGGEAMIQVFEDTIGLALHEPIKRTGMEMSVELGPGLIGEVFDGIQRPLSSDLLKTAYIPRGLKIPALRRDRKWQFHPKREVGSKVRGGDEVGHVKEGKIKHHILVPSGVSTGHLEFVEKRGEYTVEHVVARVNEDGSGGKIIEVRMMQVWPVRKSRPSREKLVAETPLVTGQRCIDTLFPVLRGGTAAIPGAFGCGKTSLMKAICKYSESDVVIFVGCGERGNEIAEMLRIFHNMKLMDRSVIIANTSNMPVAAREASIYAGITIAEYYRDMGLHVTMVADSTSRWAEALREISGRLGEVPGDSGYPTYLGSRISAFYERAGPVTCLGKELGSGSVTLIGAISPPSGDFSDPVTQATLSVVQTFWGLSTKLANERHYPAVDCKSSWNKSVSLANSFYKTYHSEFHKAAMREKCRTIILDGESLLATVHMQGKRSLSDADRVTFELAQLITTGFLYQDGSTEPLERFCPFFKTTEMLSTILTLYDLAIQAVKDTATLDHHSGITWGCIDKEMEETIKRVERLRFEDHGNISEFKAECKRLRESLKSEFDELREKMKEAPDESKDYDVDYLDQADCALARSRANLDLVGE